MIDLPHSNICLRIIFRFISMCQAYQKSRAQGLSTTFVSLMQVLTMLFTHTPASEMVGCLVDHLAEPLGGLYEAVGRKQRRGITPNVANKVYISRLYEAVGQKQRRGITPNVANKVYIYISRTLHEVPHYDL